MALAPKTVRQLQSTMGGVAAKAFIDELQGGDTSFSADTISEFTAGTGVTIDGVMLKDGMLCCGGTAEAIALDADLDTTISANTDDQIDIKVNGAADFTITANTFTALSGSTIAANTIAETTAGSGVTIDGLLLKDGDVVLADADDISLGTGTDALMRWSTGDADNHTLVIACGDDNQGLHVTDKGAVATDWNVAATTHPNIYVHSNTTPATDYLRIGDHDGSEADIDCVGGDLALKIAGNTVATLRAVGLQDNATEARTATVGGGTTGLITQGSKFVIVTSDDANKQISLPAATVGDEIRILVGSTGCELISAVATHKVNDVLVGATNEAALTATNLYHCQYVATDTWVVIGYTKLGAVQAALVPDSL